MPQSRQVVFLYMQEHAAIVKLSRPAHLEAKAVMGEGLAEHEMAGGIGGDLNSVALHAESIIRKGGFPIGRPGVDAIGVKGIKIGGVAASEQFYPPLSIRRGQYHALRGRGPQARDE